MNRAARSMSIPGRYAAVEASGSTEAAATSGLRSRIYEGRIEHRRFTPAKHRFDYAAFMCAIDLDEVDAMHRSVRGFSRNRRNLFAWYDEDHISRAELTSLLAAHGCTEPKRVVVVTNLRMLGYVFNPVSFFYCFDENGEPFACVAEVNNTFGDRKCYVLTERVGSRFRRVVRKDFYISPFIERGSTLDLRIGIPGDRLDVVMHDFENGAPVLTATLAMTERPLTSSTLWRAAVRHPLLTLRIIGAIHFEAIRLWIKKLPYWRYS